MRIVSLTLPQADLHGNLNLSGLSALYSLDLLGNNLTQLSLPNSLIHADVRFNLFQSLQDINGFELLPENGLLFFPQQYDIPEEPEEDIEEPEDIEDIEYPEDIEEPEEDIELPEEPEYPEDSEEPEFEDEEEYNEETPETPEEPETPEPPQPPPLLQLPTPTNLTITANTLTWQAVANAHAYDVFANGVFLARVEQSIPSWFFIPTEVTELDLAPFNFDGEITLQVQAIGDGFNFGDSLVSGGVGFVPVVVAAVPMPFANVVASGQFGVPSPNFNTPTFAGGSHWRLYDNGTLEVDSGIVQTLITASPWSSHSSNIQSIVFNGAITGGVSLGGLFMYLSNLTDIEGLENFDTSDVTDMNQMFREARNLTSLDLSSFDTSNVTNMGAMFTNAFSLTSLDLSSFDTSNVTNMGAMFSDASGLISLDLSSFDTSNVTNMTGMFSGASSLISLDLSSFNTSNVTVMDSMFGSMTLTLLDFPSWPLFDTSSVTSMSGMFAQSSNLTSLDLSHFDTSNVTNMNGMFSGISGLTSLDLSNFNTNIVTSMWAMFQGMTALKFLDLSSFDTNSITGTGMENTFQGTPNLAQLVLGENFQFFVLGGFWGSNPNLPAGTWVNVGTGTPTNPQANRTYTSAQLMANPAGGLADTWIRTDSLPPGWESGGGTGNVIASGQFGVDTGATFAGGGGSHWRLYDNGTLEVDSGIIAMAWTGGPGPWSAHSANVQRIIFRGTITGGAGLNNLFAQLTNVTDIEGLTYFDTSSVTNMGAMFSGASSLTSLDLSSFETNNVIEMSSMFQGASSLTSLDLSNFNTSNVTGMVNMFSNTISLTYLDLSNFDTSAVTNMGGMFASTFMAQFFSQLTLGANFRFVGPSSQSHPGFPGLPGTWVNVGNGTPANPQANRTYTSSQLMANPDGGLADTWIRIPPGWESGGGTGNVISSGRFGVPFFPNFISPTFEGGSEWRLYDDGRLEIDTGIVETSVSPVGGNSISPWGTHAYSNNIQRIVFNGAITGRNSLGSLFGNLSNVTDIEGLENFDTSSVTNMSNMFSNASSLTSLDLSSFDTSNVTEMIAMFWNTSSLTSLNLSSFDTSSLIPMAGMNSMFGGAGTARPINQLTLGANFQFVHSGVGGAVGPNLPPGTWVNVGTGTITNPQANRTYTSVELMTNPAGGLADTWIRTDAPTPPDPIDPIDPPDPPTVPFHPADIATINALISSNGLTATPAPEDGSYVPADWTFAVWNNANPRRITRLNLNSAPSSRFSIFSDTDMQAARPNLLNPADFPPAIHRAAFNLTGHIDVTLLAALEMLYLDYNSITSINVNNLQNLILLSMWDNNVSSVLLTGLPNLQTLQVGENDLSTLNVANLPALQSLYAWNNHISTLNLSGLSRLRLVSVGNNNLTGLNVQGLTLLGTNWTDPWGSWRGVLDVRQNLMPSWDNVVGWQEIGLTLGTANNFWFFQQRIHVDPPPNYFNANDIEVINRIIRQNGLNATIVTGANITALPADWNFLGWSAGLNPFTRIAGERNITTINLNNRNLTGTLDLRGLGSLSFLNVNNNDLVAMNVTDLSILNFINAQMNRMPNESAIVGLSSSTTLLFNPQQPPTPPPPPPPGGGSGGGGGNDTDNNNDTDWQDDSQSGGGSTTPSTPRPPTPRPPDATEPEDQAPPPTEPDTIEPPPDPLGPDAIHQITDPESAVNAVENALEYLLDQGGGELSADDLALLALFSENAIAQAASSHFLEDDIIIVNQPNIEELQSISFATRAEILEMLMGRGIDLPRELNANVAFITADFADINVRVEPSALLTEVDQVWIRTPFYDVSFTQSFMQNNAHTPLYLYISASEGGEITEIAQVASLNPEILTRLAQVESGGRSYTVNFSRPVTESVRLSVPPIEGDPTYQTLISSMGENIGGRYNPVTAMLEARVRQSGNFTVIENRLDFADIQNRSAEMQAAIRELASQGIILGMSPTEFAPDQPITRAQAATLVTNILAVSDPSADFNFTDVARTDWFFTPVNTARLHGIMTGTSDTTFSPHVNIPRDQIVALAARILRSEMNYRNPVNPHAHLAQFIDHPTFAPWSISDLSLAARENLIVLNANSLFNPTQPITRGEAAIILHRLYQRLW